MVLVVLFVKNLTRIGAICTTRCEGADSWAPAPLRGKRDSMQLLLKIPRRRAFAGVRPLDKAQRRD